MPEVEYAKFIENIKSCDLKQLTLESKENAILKSVLFQENQGGKLFTSIIPHTLLPSPLPYSIFKQAKELQYVINILIYVMSMDREFIIKSLEGVANNDKFVSKFLDILKSCKINQFPQIAIAGILRSDYMIDESNSKCCNSKNLKQIEINTIAASFGSHSVDLTEIHKNSLYTLYQNNLNENTKKLILNYIKNLPKNNTLLSIVNCIKKCWMLYDIKKQIDSNIPAIIFIVQSHESNRFDQIKISILLKDIFIQEGIHGLPPVFILTIDEVCNKLEFCNSTGILYLNINDKGLKYEVAVVYMRCFYRPNDFKNEQTWKIFSDIEMSIAIKIPNLATQLIGFKKFQQILANDHSIIEHYMKKAIEICSSLSQFSVETLISTFASFYSLNPNETDIDEIIRMVKNNVDKYVMKPQREGGGNNLYGKQIILKMNENLKSGTLEDFIIMSLIHPKVYKNFKVVNDSEKPIEIQSITELGIFGHFIVDGNNHLISNKSEGHLLRTKDVSIKDGGVAAGNALLDSPILL